MMPPVEIRHGDSPVVLGLPHTGTSVPADITAHLNERGRGLDDTDWHELAKERFADDIAELLYARAHKGKLGPIVLVAAPQVLGDLRDKLHKEVQDLVIAEIPKNLTNHPIDKIEEIVTQELAA